MGEREREREREREKVCENKVAFKSGTHELWDTVLSAMIKERGREGGGKTVTSSLEFWKEIHTTRELLLPFSIEKWCVLYCRMLRCEQSQRWSLSLSLSLSLALFYSLLFFTDIFSCLFDLFPLIHFHFLKMTLLLCLQYSQHKTHLAFARHAIIIISYRCHSLSTYTHIQDIVAFTHENNLCSLSLPLSHKFFSCIAFLLCLLHIRNRLGRWVRSAQKILVFRLWNSKWAFAQNMHWYWIFIFNLSMQRHKSNTQIFLIWSDSLSLSGMKVMHYLMLNIAEINTSQQPPASFVRHKIKILVSCKLSLFSCSSWVWRFKAFLWRYPQSMSLSLSLGCDIVEHWSFINCCCCCFYNVAVVQSFTTFNTAILQILQYFLASYSGL